MGGSGAVAGGGDGGEGRHKVLALHCDAGRVDEQLVIALVDLRVAPPQRVQRRLCAQRLRNQAALRSDQIKSDQFQATPG